MRLLIILTTIGFILLSVTNSLTQRSNVETSITAGFMNKVKPLGYGWHGGVNFYSRNSKKFKLDVQFSINNANEKDFPRSQFVINGLAGVRYYITNPEKEAKVFCNALLGPAFIYKFDYDYFYSGSPIGYSAGIFVNNNGFLSGISFESYQSFIFKIEYAF